MFGKGKKERAELRAELVTLGKCLDAMQKELSALHESTQKELSALKGEVETLRGQANEQKKDPDAMSEGEIMSKWIMGEKGDGF